MSLSVFMIIFKVYIIECCKITLNRDYWQVFRDFLASPTAKRPIHVDKINGKNLYSPIYIREVLLPNLQRHGC